MRARKLALALLLVAAAAAAARGMTVRQITAQLRDSTKCGCAVCPCVVAAPVRTIEGLDKLNQAKAMAALPLGWRPSVRTEACPCPVPSPCQEDPCEPAPCPCKGPEFYFADLVDELGAGECTCPEPKPCVSFPCDPVPPCPCRKTVKPEMSDYKVVTGVRCVGPGPCVTPRHFHEPEYTQKLQHETVAKTVAGRLPTAGGPYVKDQAPAVTEKEAGASYGSDDESASGADKPLAESESSEASSSESGAPQEEDSGDQFFSDSEATEEESAADEPSGEAAAAASGSSAESAPSPSDEGDSSSGGAGAGGDDGGSGGQASS